VASGALGPGFALDEDAAVVYRGIEPVEFVADRPGALVHRIDAAGNESTVTPRQLR
jgi:hypothetical protein